MGAACLRADHWLVHHLAADLPLAESFELARETGAALVVFSCTMPDAQLDAGVARGHAVGGGPQILIGAPGDRLSDLIQQARHLRRPHEAHGVRRWRT